VGGLIIQINAITKAAYRCVYALPIYYYHTKQYYWIPISSITSLRPTNNFNSSTKNQEPKTKLSSPCHINEALYHQSGTYHQLRSLSKDQALETCPYPHNHAFITDHCTDERKSHYITSHIPRPPSPPSPSPHHRRHILAQKAYRIW
jgi:hypothetical protein